MAFKIGMQIGMLPGPYTIALDHFRLLQKHFSLTSAELQMESSLYAAPYTHADKALPDVEILMALISDDYSIPVWTCLSSPLMGSIRNPMIHSGEEEKYRGSCTLPELPAG